MKKLVLLATSLLLLQACKNDVKTSEDLSETTTTETPTEKTTAQKIAAANGFENWKEVSELNFTFNVDRGEDNHYERSWTWNPKTNEVIMVTPNGRVEFDRDSLNEKTRGADASFINDKYWLMAPFHLVTDEGTTISEEENVLAPLSKKELDKITLTYGPEGGYTPGDAYDFYYDDDFMVNEWTFRKGNDSVPSMMTTWEDYEDFNGLKFAKMHQDSTGGFKLYFTNISVK
ncbi:hypothetical protein ACFQO1_08180 [Jejudonia soesokkakensis]|uniref:Uncharacterized protein n=1 Tax=Jejudonia soesokkakensis TaxID=1323432 RepID=A0ABW2MRZ8_9FLAO